MTVIPGEGQRDRQPHNEPAHQDAIDQLGPVERMPQQLTAVGNRKCSTQVRKSPLQNLVVPEAAPDFGHAKGFRWTGLVPGSP